MNIEEFCDRIDADTNPASSEFSSQVVESAKNIVWDISKFRRLVARWFDGNEEKPSDENMRKTLLYMFQNIEKQLLDNADMVASLDYVLANSVNQSTDAIRSAVKHAANHETHALHDPRTREAVWAMTGGKCTYCGCQLSKTWAEGRSDETSISALYIEHVVPRSAGGPDNIANYVPSCNGCNTSKSNGHVLDFITRKLPNRLRLVGGEAAA